MPADGRRFLLAQDFLATAARSNLSADCVSSAEARSVVTRTIQASPNRQARVDFVRKVSRSSRMHSAPVGSRCCLWVCASKATAPRVHQASRARVPVLQAGYLACWRTYEGDRTEAAADECVLHERIERHWVELAIANEHIYICMFVARPRVSRPSIVAQNHKSIRRGSAMRSFARPHSACPWYAANP